VRLIKEKFDDIVNYSVLIKGMKCIEYQTKNLPVRFPSNYHYDNGNMFDNKIYVNYIIDDKRKFTLAFENTAQVRLFEFLVTELQINDIKVKIPAFPDEAKKVLSTLKENYNKYVPQIKSLLKQHRINASEIIIFRNIVFNL
jgi:hypothetical protein